MAALIIIDLNLLLYAHDTSSPYQASAKRWIEEVMSSEDLVLIPWLTVLGFLRVCTSARILKNPVSIETAISDVQRWLEEPNVRIVDPGERHWGILQDLLKSGQCRGPLVTDAHLAALAIEHGATLYSSDRDFTRFPGLRFKNPLAG